MKKAVIFDRDGTLIVDKIYLNDVNLISYLPGVFSALQKLRDGGFVFCVATNQSGVPRGLVQLKNLWAIHEKMRNDFAMHGIDFLDFYYAPFPTDSDHYMRKPNPGMLMQAAHEHRLDMSRSWMIGDRATDVIAGHRAGCRSILLVQPGKEHESQIEKPEAICNTLEEVALFILQASHSAGLERNSR